MSLSPSLRVPDRTMCVVYSRILFAGQYSTLAGFCSARLQVGTLKSNGCSPEGERYMKQN